VASTMTAKKFSLENYLKSLDAARRHELLLTFMHYSRTDSNKSACACKYTCTPMRL